MNQPTKIPSHPDLEDLEYECEDLGITLTCFFEHEAEQRGSREAGTGLQLEPDYPATYTLMYVYTPEGLDISPVMSPKKIDEIEAWAADYFEQRREDHKAEAAYDRWLDRQYEDGGLI